MRKTKIIATLGPSSCDIKTYEKMVNAGLDVARLNMSHGTYEEHKKYIDNVKRINKKLGTNVGIMLDTKGPEIRLGNFKEEVNLEKGQKYILTTKEIVCDKRMAYVTYKNITSVVTIGTKILLNDGLVALEVDNVTDNEVECTVLNSGIIKSKKGVNIPGIKMKMDFLTKADKADIKFGIENGVEYIAASFVNCREDVLLLRKYLKYLKADNVKIISKIESRVGVDNISSILEVSDGLMVARGDMGVEVELENLPIIQKNMIKSCILSGKIVITATQMLESMVNNPRPTRAEVLDIANAIYDGTSCIMLSAETASGNYPVECIEMMDRISRNIEKNIDYWCAFKKRNINDAAPACKCDLNEAETFRKQISFSVCGSAMFTEAKAIICISDKGKTPDIISSFRPKCPVFVITSNVDTYTSLSMQWGIKAIFVKKELVFDNILKKGLDIIIKNKYLEKGDLVILSGGTKKESKTKNYLSSQALGAIIRI